MRDFQIADAPAGTRMNSFCDDSGKITMLL
jgi:hypothetical protein